VPARGKTTVEPDDLSSEEGEEDDDGLLYEGMKEELIDYTKDI
jgi:hypothetical protein